MIQQLFFSSPSFVLNSLSFEDQQIPLESLHPDLLQRIHRAVERSLDGRQVTGQIKCCLQGKNVSIQWGEAPSERIEGSQKQELTLVIHRALDFNRHIDRLTPPPSLKPFFPKAVAEMKEERFSPKTLFLARAKMAVDTVSISRQVLGIASKAGIIRQVLGRLDFGIGSFWVAGAVQEVWEGILDRKTARAIGDEEGKGRANLSVASGTFGILGSIFYILANALEIGGAGSLAIATLGVGVASSGFFCLGCGVGLGIGGLGISRCRSFRATLNEYIENTQLTELERVRGAVCFLRESMTVTDQEEADLGSEGPIQNRVECKTRDLKRRTSLLSVSQIMEQSDSILEGLRETPVDLSQAQKLVKNIQEDNLKKEGLYHAMILTCILCLSAFTLLFIGTCGIAPTILFILSAGTVLSTGIYLFFPRLNRT